MSPPLLVQDAHHSKGDGWGERDPDPRDSSFDAHRRVLSSRATQVEEAREREDG